MPREKDRFRRDYEEGVRAMTRRAGKMLVGRRIVGARYLTEEERLALGWRCSVLVIELDDGSLLFPSTDDEGNDGGAMFGQDAEGNDNGGFPVVRSYH